MLGYAVCVLALCRQMPWRQSTQHIVVSADKLIDIESSASCTQCKCMLRGNGNRTNLLTHWRDFLIDKASIALLIRNGMMM